ncbi:alpha/beta fold hydrolase [Actinomadura atramentaria]|uniref:alpha/beta fold hydrolase n=1 Tax=Actinomadura atramentaria TaxID=1990 RepID=UPI000371E47A|nr:alpha/beta hydrolase [Actinomadura atramentaria]
MATYVLVPGFWLGAWAWDRVADALRASGHAAHPITLTGVADRASEASPDITLDTHIEDVLAAIDATAARKVVLVAHSGANMPVTGAADQAPDRVERIIYVDTAPLPSGWAQIDFLDPEKRAETLAKIGDGSVLPPPPFDPTTDPQALTDLTEEALSQLRTRATPQPARTATDPLHRPAALPTTPRTMIATTIPLAAVHKMTATGAPAFTALATPGWTFTELPTSHWPMLSAPTHLAKALTT